MGASKVDLESAIVIGFQKNGDLYLASSLGNSGEIMIMLEVMKTYLVNKRCG